MTKKSSFKDLLERSVSIHHRNLRTLAVELFKVFKDLSPLIFFKLFIALQAQRDVHQFQR